MNHFKNLEGFCRGINVSSPIRGNFDIKNLQKVMYSIKSIMPPFTHELYILGIKCTGEAISFQGHEIDPKKSCSLFINSPFQVLSWDSLKNWSGYVILLDSSFIANFESLRSYFLKENLFSARPTELLDISDEQSKDILRIFEDIYDEANANQKDKYDMIESYLMLLLNKISRIASENIGINDMTDLKVKNEVKLFNKYKKLIMENFQEAAADKANAGLLTTSYYADLMGIHPNYLNSICKKVTGKKALSHVHEHVVELAKSYLIQTGMSIKEISYKLSFESQSSFNKFFRRLENDTPVNFRKKHYL